MKRGSLSNRDGFFWFFVPPRKKRGRKRKPFNSFPPVLVLFPTTFSASEMCVAGKNKFGDWKLRGRGKKKLGVKSAKFPIRPTRNVSQRRRTKLRKISRNTIFLPYFRGSCKSRRGKDDDAFSISKSGGPKIPISSQGTVLIFGEGHWTRAIGILLRPNIDQSGYSLLYICHVTQIKVLPIDRSSAPSLASNFQLNRS